MNDWEVMAIRQLADDLSPRLCAPDDTGEYAAALENLLFAASGQLLEIALGGQGDLDMADCALEAAAETIARARARLAKIAQLSWDEYVVKQVPDSHSVGALNPA